MAKVDPNKIIPFMVQKAVCIYKATPVQERTKRDFARC